MDYATNLGRLLDSAKILALLLLLIYLPVLALAALLVVLTSPGPAFVSRAYRRPNGQLVDLFEFRTECWSRWQPTPVGRCLRQSSLYRLPALVNIIRGEIGVGEKVKAAAPGPVD